MTVPGRHPTEALGAYVLGALDGREARQVAEHLAECTACRTEFGAMAAMRDALGDVPPEAFLQGPPEGGDLLVRRALRQARQERKSAATAHQVIAVAVAAVVAAVALGGGVVLGRDSGAGQVAASTVAPGARTISATHDGAKITATITPAAGWVRVHALVSGIAPGQRCRIVVVSRSGAREVAGSWLVSAKAVTPGTSLDGSALVAPDRIAAIEVQNFDGHTFVSARF
jgi:anti-sigma factor RsiW